MLSKCANPPCQNAFCYFHEGKLYLIEPKAASSKHRPQADMSGAGRSRTLELSLVVLFLLPKHDHSNSRRLCNHCGSYIHNTEQLRYR